MNAFRLSGISCVAQVLYLVTFITRYLDLPFVFFSYYNTAMKHYFIFATACTVFLMLVARDTYDSNHDSKWMFLLLVPPAVLSQFVNYEYSVIEVGFAFSQFLEAVAMLPQFVMVCKMGQAEVTVVCYLRMLASYRLLYIFNWIYRYNMEGFYDGISVVSGTVQFLTYAVFFALFYNGQHRHRRAAADPVASPPLRELPGPVGVPGSHGAVGDGFPGIGGVPATKGTWPWMVSLGERHGTSVEWFCGGTLISPLTVLTAAHCVRGKQADRLTLRLAEYRRSATTSPDRDGDSDAAGTAAVRRIVQHPLYHANQHDLALLLLRRPAAVGAAVVPACLPPPRADHTNATVHLAGWGVLEWAGDLPDQLQDIELVVVETGPCEDAYRAVVGFEGDFPGGFQGTKLCATGTEGTNRDACQGDSGGPLVARGADGRFSVVGVVSGGRGCGNPKFPGVYTKVSEYIEWILENSE
ncbi:ER lumen protein-retaining receptor [Amphibalanus amphitrite]|uniref:ER lumen protein-retaining receptor n=1 Tax=Amphibalanus amphitrite TaxID=1232801 RepID=A0A6A4WNN6_AMPAM|nr:ER lumen protein-retaining receptor [Amphibalanus amphitrite]